MSYARTFSIPLGPAYAGLDATTLRAQLYDTSGVASGAAISTGFAGSNGAFTFTKADYADATRYRLDVYINGDSSNVLFTDAVNPPDLNSAQVTAAVPTAAQNRTEMDANSTKLANLDAAVSTRATPADVTGSAGMTPAQEAKIDKAIELLQT